MPVTVRIPPPLRPLVGDQSQVACAPGTIREILGELDSRHAGFLDRVTEGGNLRRFVNVFVAGEDVRFADGIFALEVARATGGSIESVTEEEIVDGIQLLAETTGIFTETAGGVTAAVLAKLAREGAIGKGEQVVAYITGDGLKTLDAVADRVVRHPIDPTVASFESALDPSSVAA